jgi:hypothetical protein
MIAPPGFVPARHRYGLHGLGMTVDEARQILASGNASQEQLAQAYQVYYSWYQQQPSVVAAATGLSYEDVSERMAAGETPQQITGPNQYMQLAEQLQNAPIPYYPAEQCEPLDTACVERNAARQRANMALLAERQRQINLNICLANALRNGQPESVCAQYATPIPIPSAPGTIAYTNPADAERIAQQQLAWIQQQQQQQASAGATSGGSGTTAGTGTQTYRPQVRLENASRPGQTLRAGDTFRATITGAQPGAAVEVEAYQDGRSLGRTRYGQADAQGNFTLTGTIGSEHVGHWREIWHIGNAAVTIEFDVQPAARPTYNITDLTPGRGGSATPGRTEPSGGTSTLLQSVPQWVWIAAAALFVWRILQK